MGCRKLPKVTAAREQAWTERGRVKSISLPVTAASPSVTAHF